MPWSFPQAREKFRASECEAGQHPRTTVLLASHQEESEPRSAEGSVCSKAERFSSTKWCWRTSVSFLILHGVQPGVIFTICALYHASL